MRRAPNGTGFRSGSDCPDQSLTTEFGQEEAFTPYDPNDCNGGADAPTR